MKRSAAFATLSDDDSSDDEGSPTGAGIKVQRLSDSVASGQASDGSSGSDLSLVRKNFVKSTKNNESQYSSVALKMMERMGHKKGTGLGKNEQGRVDPVESSKQRGRRGLGHSIAGFEAGSDEWDFEKEVVTAEETVEWIPSCELGVPSLEELREWTREGEKKLSIEDETTFCSRQTLANVLNSKSVFDNLEEEEMRKARTRSNPFETIRGAFFLNRAAMKMANMDAVLDFMFTNPKDDKGNPVLSPRDLLYFADVCAGPGGFSEYVLWRKACDVKGFGFTLRGSNDFKLEDFHAAPCELFEPHYGVNGAEGDGDVYSPDNLRMFRDFVMDNTEGKGVHFVMADGGFSVDGQENIQEILSKRLYLCQFLCALMILRTGGHFVCKLFDIFTPFSVGLVYLMYRAFKRISIFKPVTSRPANSERYIVCDSKHADASSIEQYFFELNERMCDIWPGRETSHDDILEIVPIELITSNEMFYDYIYNSNERLGNQQIMSLMKIQVFAMNTSLHEMRQADMRRQCLERWLVPDKVRTAPDRSEKPADRFIALTKDKITDYLQPAVELTTSNLEDKIKSVYDFRYFVVGSDQRSLIISFGRSHVYQFCGNDKWKKLSDEIKFEIPANTVLEVEFVTELRGEGKGQRKVMAVHVIDALFLYGTDVRSLHFNERIEKLKKFVKAITKTTRSDLAPVRVKESMRLEELKALYKSLERLVVKGCGQTPRLAYCCYQKNDEKRYFVPAGLLLIRTVRDPWMLAVSKSKNMKYFFNTLSRISVFQAPIDAVASYLDCTKGRMMWKWEATSGESESNRKLQVTSKSLPFEIFLKFIHKLTPASH